MSREAMVDLETTASHEADQFRKELRSALLTDRAVFGTERAVRRHPHVYDSQLICLLVDNAEAICEVLRAAAGTVRTAHRQKIGDAIVPAWWDALVAALLALNLPASPVEPGEQPGVSQGGEHRGG